MPGIVKEVLTIGSKRHRETGERCQQKRQPTNTKMPTLFISRVAATTTMTYDSVSRKLLIRVRAL